MAISTGQGVESRITLKVQSNEVEAAIERLAKLKSTLQSVEQSNAKTQKIIEQAMVYHNRSQEIANRTAQNTITNENNRVIKKQESEAKIQRLAEESATRQVAIEEQSNAKILALQQRLADEKIRLDAKNVAQIEKLNAQTEKYNVGIEKTRLQMEKYKNSVEKATEKTNLFKKAIDFSKIMVNVHLIKRLSNAVMTLFQSSADFYENLNLFNIVMRKSNEEGTKFVNTLQNIFGLDESPLLRYTASFKGMANNMGIVENKAYTMAESLTKMTLDLSAMYNTTIDDSFEALMSAITGQVKSIRDKFAGIDITEKSLEVQLKYMGINDRSIGQMNYAEKSIVRYLSIQRQAADAQGVFASEMMKPAQMLKLLGDRVARLARAIGNIFIPILSKTLPYIMATVEVLTILAQMLADTIALLFGFDLGIFEESDNQKLPGFGIEDNFNNATESVKKFKRQLQGFDVLNVITTPTDTNKNNGATNGLNIDPRLLQAIKEWDMHLERASDKIVKIRDNMLEWLGIIREVDEKTGKVTYHLADGFTNLEKIGTVIGIFASIGLIKKIFSIGKALYSAYTNLKLINGILMGNKAAESMAVFLGKGDLVAKIGAMGKGLSAGALGLVGTIALATAVIGYSYAKFDGFRQTCNGLVDSLKNLLGAFEPLIEAIKGLIDVAKPIFSTAWYTILLKIIPVLQEGIGFLAAVINFLAYALQGDIVTGYKVFKETLNKTSFQVKLTKGQIQASLYESINDFKKAGKESGEGYEEELNKSDPAEIGKNFTVGIHEGIETEVETSGPSFWERFKTIFLRQIFRAFGIHSPSTVLRDEVGKFLQSGIFEGLLSNLGTNVKNWATNFLTNIKTSMNSLNFKSIGSNVLTGIVNGMSNIGNSIKNWGTKFFDKIKDVLGIHSPSILAEKEVGINVGLGTIKGMEKTIQEVDSYTDSLLKTLNENLTIETPTISYSSIGLPNINDINAQISTNGLSINESINTNNLNHKIDLLSSAMSSMQDAILKDKNSEYVFPIYVGGEKVDQVVEKRQQRIENMYGISR